MPDISPDFSAPGLSAVVQIASWALAIGMVIAGLGLIVSLITLGFKGFGNGRLQEMAGPAAIWSLGVLALLGSFSGLMALAVGFDLGL